MDIETLLKFIKENPLENINFGLVIEKLTGFRVIPFNSDNIEDKRILETLMKSAQIAADNVNKTGILKPRPNEVGNDIEPYVMNALNNAGYKCSPATTSSGKKKSTGYPDLQFADDLNKINYLECKTYNIANVSTTQQSFYLSPSNEFKVCSDAHHFLISFEIFEAGQSGRNYIYKIKKRKIITLESLLVDLKYEFNSDNKRLYSKDMILADEDQ